MIVCKYSGSFPSFCLVCSCHMCVLWVFAKISSALICIQLLTFGKFPIIIGQKYQFHARLKPDQDFLCSLEAIDDLVVVSALYLAAGCGCFFLFGGRLTSRQGFSPHIFFRELSQLVPFLSR
jgi:hypothetical protein